MGSGDFDVQGFARDINVILVLATLREHEKHGYQIAQDVERQSNGLFRFRHGTLYPILHRLEKEGLIEGAWARHDGGRKKKVYALTASGRQQLEGRGRRVNEILLGVNRMIGGPGEAPA